MMPSREKIHSYLYVLGLCGLAFSLTMSLYVMSIAQFFLFANWLAEGNLKEKLKNFFSNKAALLLSGMFLLHVIGAFYSYHIHDTLDDLRIKLPLLVLPLIISTSPAISKKSFYLIAFTHITGTLISGIISIWRFYTQPVLDIRDIFIFISHIRYALNICMDIFILLYFLTIKKDFPNWAKVLFTVLIGWFIYYLFFMESITGITILSISLFVMFLYFAIKKTKSYYRLVFILLPIAVILIPFFIVYSTYREYKNNIEKVDKNNIDLYTRHGNPYLHDFDNKMTDNGYYTWLYVSYEELRPAWNKRSKIHFDSLDMQKQPVKFTLIRYLTSKGLRKDMDGVNALTDEDVRNIENGIANILYLDKGNFKNRIKNVIWEIENYKITRDASRQSLMQRIEFWKTSLRIIKKHFWLGVGNGDAKKTFAAQLYLDNSLLKDTGLRSHNQFFTVMISFGFVGLILFLICMLYPPLKLHKFSDFLYLSFFLIAFISMFTDDTLETQAGVTFFAFFNTLLLFIYGNYKEIPKNH